MGPHSYGNGKLLATSPFSTVISLVKTHPQITFELKEVFIGTRIGAAITGHGHPNPF